MKKVSFFAQFISLSVGVLVLASSCRPDPVTPPTTDDPNDIAETISDCDYFTQPRTLSDIPGKAIDYLISCDMDVTAALTINPGTVIAFKDGKSMKVKGSGSITANGTSAQHIIFRGQNRTIGFWTALGIESNSASNILSFVEITDGGKDEMYIGGTFRQGGLILGGTGRLDIKNSIISNQASYGMVIDDDVTGLIFSTNQITTSQTPMMLYANDLGKIDANSSFTGNTYNYLFVKREEVTTAQNWNKLSVPARFETSQNVSVTAALTISPGATFEFESEAALLVEDSGSLTADGGNSGTSITFRGAEDVTGAWRGLFVSSNNPANLLNYTIIKNGGEGEEYIAGGFYGGGNVTFVGSGKLRVKNSTFSKSLKYGMVVKNDADLSEFTNNVCTANADAPMQMMISQLGKLDGTSSFTGNTNDYIDVLEKSILVNNNQTWKKLTVPSRINGTSSIASAITVAPGARFIGAPGSGLLFTTGTLNAVGTPSEMISFKGENASAGYWAGLFIGSNSANNRIEYATVSDAGKGEEYVAGGFYGDANITLADGLLTVKNCIISNSFGCGLRTGKASAILTESNNTFSGNTGGNVCN